MLQTKLVILNNMKDILIYITPKFWIIFNVMMYSFILFA